MNNYVPQNKRLSLSVCKRILNNDDVFYTDDEIVELRDWLYHMADIVFDTLDREEDKKCNLTSHLIQN